VAHGPARCRAVRRLHLQHRPGTGVVVPALARRYLRRLLPGPVRREQPLPRIHGLGDAVVLGARGVVRLLRRKESTQLRDEGLLLARRRWGVRDVLDHRRRVRADEWQLMDARHDCLRPPRALGGLARGLAATVPNRKGADLDGAQGAADAPVARLAAGHHDDLGSTSTSATEHHCH